MVKAFISDKENERMGIPLLVGCPSSFGATGVPGGLFQLKRKTVGALVHGGVIFVGAYLDFVQGAITS